MFSQIDLLKEEIPRLTALLKSGADHPFVKGLTQQLAGLESVEWRGSLSGRKTGGSLSLPHQAAQITFASLRLSSPLLVSIELGLLTWLTRY